MNRRSVLAGFGTLPFLAGCVSEAPDYEECPQRFVAMNDLPARPRAEAEVALEDGQYESEGELTLAKVVDFDTVYLMANDTYYQPQLESNSPPVLSLTEETPTHSNTLVLKRQSDTYTSAQVTLQYNEQETLLDKTVTFNGQDQIPLIEDEVRFGAYTMEITVGEDEPPARKTWTVNRSYFVPTILIEDDGDVVRQQGVADLPPSCEWDTSGNLTRP